MKNARTIMTLGILVAIMPALGFPGGWKSFFYSAFGILISLLVFREMRSQNKTRVSGSNEYVDNKLYEQSEFKNEDSPEVKVEEKE